MDHFIEKIRMVFMAVLVGHIVRDICHGLDSNVQSLKQWNTRLSTFRLINKFINELTHDFLVFSPP